MATLSQQSMKNDGWVPLRVKVEEFHKSLKHNIDLAKSPTKIIRTQSNHIYLSVLSFLSLNV